MKAQGAVDAVGPVSRYVEPPWSLGKRRQPRSLVETGWCRRPIALLKWSGDEVLIPAALLHHFYTAVETILTRLVMGLEGSVPGGADPHSHLLALSALEIAGTRPALITVTSLESLRELLAFRHLFRHGYSAQFRPERLKEFTALAVATWPAVKLTLERAQQFVLRCATEGSG